MWYSSKEFRTTFKPLKKERRNGIEMSFCHKSDVVEGDSEIWIERRHHWKVPKEVDGDNDYASVTYCEFFVKMEDIPWNQKKTFLCSIQFLNKRHPRLSAALEARKI